MKYNNTILYKKRAAAASLQPIDHLNMLWLRMFTEDGTHYFLHPAFLVVGTLSLLPDGIKANLKLRGWVVSL